MPETLPEAILRSVRDPRASGRGGRAQEARGARPRVGRVAEVRVVRTPCTFVNAARRRTPVLLAVLWTWACYSVGMAPPRFL